MKRVLVTQRLVSDEKTGETRDALDVRWGPFLGEAGLMCVPASSRIPAAALVGDLGCEGLLLTGGNDLAFFHDSPLSRARDQFEGELLDLFLAAGKPVFGVCRGLQVLGHRYGLKLSPVEGHVGVRHPVELSFESRLFAGHKDLDANSSHHAGLTGESAELLVAARSAEGAIEALEHRKERLAGMMWHPEREESFRSADIALFRDFFT